MNAIVALCSFCEVNGPSVLLCTQTYHNNGYGKATSNGNRTTTRTDSITQVAGIVSGRNNADESLTKPMGEIREGSKIVLPPTVPMNNKEECKTSTFDNSCTIPSTLSKCVERIESKNTSRNCAVNNVEHIAKSSRSPPQVHTNTAEYTDVCVQNLERMSVDSTPHTISSSSESTMLKQPLAKSSISACATETLKFRDKENSQSLTSELPLFKPSIDPSQNTRSFTDSSLGSTPSKLTNPITTGGEEVVFPCSEGKYNCDIENDSKVEENRPTESTKSSSRHQSPSRAASRNGISTCCNACNLLKPGCSGYRSKDKANGVEYVSTPVPLNSKLFTIVRKACVRSLSIEMLPGREGPAVFGDTENGYVLNYAFTLKDPQARGFQRIYSIVFLMTDLPYLMNSFQFLAAQFRQLVMYLKQQADLSASRPQPQANASLQQSYMTQSHFNSGRHIPRARHQTRPTPSSLKSLDDLTDTANMASRLHQTFAWILKSCSARLVEIPTEGPKQITTGMFNVNKSAHHFTIASKVELSTAYYAVVKSFIQSCPFVVVHPMEGINNEDCVDGRKPKRNNKECETLGLGWGTAVDGSKNSVKHEFLYKCIHRYSSSSCKTDIDPSQMKEAIPGVENGATISSFGEKHKHKSEEKVNAHTNVTMPDGCVTVSGNCLDESVEGGVLPILLTPAQVGKAVDHSSLRLILYHMLIGNQIIVRGDYEALVISVLFSLAYLLPRDCCTMVPYSHVYRARWECNFLGLSSHAVLNAPLDWKSSVVVDVAYKSLMPRIPEISISVLKPVKAPPVERILSDVDFIGSEGFLVIPNNVKDYKVHACSFLCAAYNLSGKNTVTGNRCSQRSQYPLPDQNAETCILLNEFLRVLTESTYSEAVKHQYLIALKEEWFNKAKVFLRFAKTHPKSTDVHTLTTMLKALQCGTSDLPVLRFWMEALSRDDRAIILNKAGLSRNGIRNAM
eukprot:CFRG5299T1